MRKKCYIYTRVSTAAQTEGYSLEAQTERLRKYADYKEMEVVREYCDAGRSGKSITGRPKFQRMLQDVSEERDGVAFILVFKLSRFGRNAADVLNSLQFIQDYSVNLICVEDGIDSSKDSGKLTITVLSAVAEIERENILVQTMEGRKQKAREGKWNGGQAPFGYDLDSRNSTLVVNEEEAEIVRIIYDKFVHTDMGADAICNYLNQRGYTKKKVRGHELNYFARGLIMKILDNPVYTGKIAYGKNVTEKVKGTRDEYRRVKTDDYLLADGLHEAIVDEETWEAAREKRKRTGVRFVKTHSLEHEHILTGLIRCPLCGGGMSGTVQRRQNKKTGEYKDTFYYRCHHRKKVDGKICDYKPMLNQKVFNAEVEEFIRYMVEGDEFRSFVQEKLEEKVAEFEEAMKDIDAKIGASYGKEITGKKLYEFLLDFDILYDKMTDMEKKEFMNTFIEKIELKNETVNNGTGQGSRIEHIDLAFPVYYGECKGTRIRMPEENTVETVVLLSQLKQKPDDYINVTIELDDMDITSAETKATYDEIKKYVAEHNAGMKVSNLYISQVKRKCGIEVGKNYNLPKNEDSRQPQCPEDKESAIVEALKHFKMNS